MPKNLHKAILSATLAFFAASASAYDFTAEDLFFNITSKTAKTVELTYKGDTPGVGYLEGGYYVPQTVKYNNVSYTVTSVGESAFSGCKDLNTITLPSTVTSIGANAFQDCSGLESFSFPTSLKTIGESAFYGCTGIKKIYLTTTVESVGDYAFSGCTNLATVYVPANVEDIGVSAFDDTKWYNDQPTIIYINKMLYAVKTDDFEETSYTVKDGTTKICGSAFRNCFSLTSITFPPSLTSIGSNAFMNCQGLTSLTLTKYIKSIGKNAFMSCKSLKTVTFPASVTEIPDGMFYNCASLEKIVVPNSVNSIGASAFYNCSSLASTSMPGTVSSIGSMAYGECKALTSIVCETIVPPSLGDNVFLDVDKTITVRVPKNSLNDYKSADQWKDFTKMSGANFTGIDNITINDDAQQKVYTTSGQRLSAPVKGINIINGKKYIVN